MRFAYRFGQELAVIDAQAVFEREDGRWRLKIPAGRSQFGEVSAKVRM